MSNQLHKWKSYKTSRREVQSERLSTVRDRDDQQIRNSTEDTQDWKEQSAPTEESSTFYPAWKFRSDRSLQNTMPGPPSVEATEGSM